MFFGSIMLPPTRSLRKVIVVYSIGAMLGGAYLFASTVFPSLQLGLVNLPLDLKTSFLPENPLLLSAAVFANNVQVAFLACIVPLALAGVMGRLKKKSTGLGVPSALGEATGELRRHLPSWTGGNHLRSAKRKINRAVPLSCPAVPGLIAAENGGILGFFLAASWLFHGASGVWVFARHIIPHGVIEIPAILTACALGLSLSAKPVTLLRHGKGEKRRKRRSEP